MKKSKLIMAVSVVSAIAMITALAIWFYAEQTKFKVSYFISQSKGPVEWQETICSNEDCDDSYSISAKKYKYSGSKYFDEIIEIDEYSGNTKQYAFRMSTGWLNMQNIEIGRIELPFADKNAAIKCSFNFRGAGNWQPCSEKQFIKSLVEISKLKEEKGKEYEEIAQKIDNLKKDCEADRLNPLSCIQEYSKLEREAGLALKTLRNASIELK